jgi:N-acetylmuramoyl-L-alanine amidase
MQLSRRRSARYSATYSATYLSCLAVLALVCAAFSSGHALATQANQPPAVLTGLESEQARIELTFDIPVSVEIIHLDNPPRLVIDLPETSFAAFDSSVSLPRAVSGVRYGSMSPGHSRIVFSLSLPVIAEITSVEATTRSVSLELVEASAGDFAARALRDAETLNPQQPAKSDRLAQAGATGGPFTLVIDPGHGGIDGGAEGSLGTQEKDITLAFALKLRDALADEKALRVVMTRDSDSFVSLRDRVKIARQNNAGLFLSIHGDSIDLRDIRGATIYTLSDQASDAIASALAAEANLSDTIAGLPPMQPDAETNTILADLLRQETDTFSHKLASELVVHLRENSVEMINNPLRSAGFAVLTAPDVPSLLLELGYLSNVEDEKLMRDPAWRERTAKVIADALRNYAREHGASGMTP